MVRTMLLYVSVCPVIEIFSTMENQLPPFLHYVFSEILTKPKQATIIIVDMVTTVSVTTVTTVTTIAAMGLTAAVSMAAAVVLILLLSSRELALATGTGFSARLGRFLTIGIGPLLLVFSAVVVLKIVTILS